MEQFLSLIALILDSDQLAIYLTAWGFLAVVLTIAVILRRLTMHVAALEEAKRRERVEARRDGAKIKAEREAAERALAALQNNAASTAGPRTARDFTPYGYSDHAA